MNAVVSGLKKLRHIHKSEIVANGIVKQSKNRIKGANRACPISRGLRIRAILAEEIKSMRVKMMNIIVNYVFRLSHSVRARIRAPHQLALIVILRSGFIHVVSYLKGGRVIACEIVHYRESGNKHTVSTNGIPVVLRLVINTVAYAKRGGILGIPFHSAYIPLSNALLKNGVANYVNVLAVFHVIIVQPVVRKRNIRHSSRCVKEVAGAPVLPIAKGDRPVVCKFCIEAVPCQLISKGELSKDRGKAARTVCVKRLGKNVKASADVIAAVGGIRIYGKRALYLFIAVLSILNIVSSKAVCVVTYLSTSAITELTYST